jgi:hypothetical protein
LGSFGAHCDVDFVEEAIIRKWDNGVTRSRGFTSVTHKDREKDQSFEKLSMVGTVD